MGYPYRTPSFQDSETIVEDGAEPEVVNYNKETVSSGHSRAAALWIDSDGKSMHKTCANLSKTKYHQRGE